MDVIPRAGFMFSRFRVTLRLYERVNGSLKQLSAETAVQLGDGVRWKGNIYSHTKTASRTAAGFAFDKTVNIKCLMTLSKWVPGSLCDVNTPSLLSDFNDQSQLKKKCLPSGVKSQRRQSGMCFASH